jgi:protein involved in polysaccharide export with SLBB domain
MTQRPWVRGAWATCGLLLAAASDLPAQLTDTPGGVAPVEQYRIQPGDVLGIVVSVSLPDYAAPASVTVGPDGAFSYPVVGEVQAAGKTRREVAAAIRTALEELYRKVDVTVNVNEYRTQNVYVLGEVGKPGPVPVLGATLTLTQAVAQAGGYTETAAGVSLLRAGEEPRTVNRGAGETELLQPGDILNVVRRRPLVVVGEVTRPGAVDLPPGARLTDALALVGGLAATADARHAVLVDHESRTTVVDLEQVLTNPQSQINLPIAEYHTLIVGPRQAIAVIGEVKSPGLYPGGHGTRLTQLLAQAGGLTSAAATNATGVDEQGAVTPLDLAVALSAPGSEADVSVQGLRTVVVPRERREVTVLGAVQKPGVTAPEVVPLPLSSVLGTAGGVTEKADLRNVLVCERDGTQRTVDAAPLVGLSGAAGGVLDDPLVANGAVVIVPLRVARVTVLGAVNGPGNYTFGEGDTVVDAIGLAGGFTAKSTLVKVALLRRKGDVVEVTEINLRGGLRGGDDLLAGPLQDRDVVMVPTRAGGNWSQIAAILFGLSTVYRNIAP